VPSSAVVKLEIDLEFLSGLPKRFIRSEKYSFALDPVPGCQGRRKIVPAWRGIVYRFRQKEEAT